MANVTLIVAPNVIGDLIGVYMIEVSARKMKAKDKTGKVLFSCTRRATDDVEQGFIALVKLIAQRAADKKIARIEKV